MEVLVFILQFILVPRWLHSYFYLHSFENDFQDHNKLTENYQYDSMFTHLYILKSDATNSEFAIKVLSMKYFYCLQVQRCSKPGALAMRVRQKLNMVLISVWRLQHANRA